MPRLIITWMALAPVDLVATSVAYVASPFLAAWSVLTGRDTLPGRWQWFSTLDDTLDGGQHQWPEIYPPNATGVELWWQRTCWICRNPAQGFALKMLGIPGEMVSQVAYSSAQVEPPGFYWHIDASGRKIGWGYKTYLPLWGKRYVKIWLGWADIKHDGRNHMIEWQFNPFRTW